MATACSTDSFDMQINKKTRLQLKIQSGLFLILFLVLIGLLGWLSTQYQFNIDLTVGQRNSLSQPTLRLLQGIQQPVKISAFVSPLNESKPALDSLLERYQRAQALISFEIINPDLAPDLLRQFNITRDGEVLIEVGGRSENIIRVTEQNITNSIARLLRQGERFLVFLEGHGERNPYADANHDLQLFASRLSQKGFLIETLNLIDIASIPDNTDVMIIADPASTLFPGEVKLIRSYVEAGGNLLWLREPVDNSGLDELAEILDLEFLPGVIVDPTTQLLGLNRVDFALTADYPRHAVTTGIDSISLYPTASPILKDDQAQTWSSVPLMQSHDRSWNENGTLVGQISPGDDEGEQFGPHTIALALERELEQQDDLVTQRIVVVGDADFLSNQYLGNGSNLALGLNMLNWLSHDDSLIAISPKQAADSQLELSANAQLFIALLFLLMLPLLLLGSGIGIWIRRRKR
ncbi:MAG: GldG family protein [Gammaproteobacteria bacterium]|nr:GldG family protein [Gammaproteobacteria bacterium]